MLLETRSLGLAMSSRSERERGAPPHPAARRLVLLLSCRATRCPALAQRGLPSCRVQPGAVKIVSDKSVSTLTLAAPPAAGGALLARAAARAAIPSQNGRRLPASPLPPGAARGGLPSRVAVVYGDFSDAEAPARSYALDRHPSWTPASPPPTHGRRAMRSCGVRRRLPVACRWSVRGLRPSLIPSRAHHRPHPWRMCGRWRACSWPTSRDTIPAAVVLDTPLVIRCLRWRPELSFRWVACGW